MIEKFCRKVDDFLGERGAVIAWILIACIFCVAMSYGSALVGEPQALWLWHNILGVL
jgi:hypothetical protein